MYKSYNSFGDIITCHPVPVNFKRPSIWNLSQLAAAAINCCHLNDISIIWDSKYTGEFL